VQAIFGPAPTSPTADEVLRLLAITARQWMRLPEE
jgi:hypothetical protein